ncbi:hypothetical protein [Marinobacter sp.]|uniref:hypothetical protein n=1 Tax=Marinobacter sp. TaxID=50741 RepID=UPI002B275722|nr:hypothetical protein [Marinobacter sp.]
MPINKADAIQFLETQWSSINDNKVKGIKAEVEFVEYLENNNVHYIPGGWIMMPGKNSKIDIPTSNKICLIPVCANFSWSGSGQKSSISPALMSAYNYFQQVGVTTYIVEPSEFNESSFQLPKKRTGNTKAQYPRSYQLDFKTISPRGSFESVRYSEIFNKFPERNGNSGLRCNKVGRINQSQYPWNNNNLVKELFWFEYARYYCQVDFLLSNNDLDLFIIGPSGCAYPVELKSKKAASDSALGEWFGLDLGPFAKMSFFTSNSMNTDALYVVQEVDDDRNFVNWLAIRFTDLVKSCSWVGRSGGQGMSGGASSTIKIPKLAFQNLSDLLVKL